ncbi:hypothetical protein RHGRI_030202 [Rhododendron griersonianum]|uniref:Uncharacterized protein n=1 Tax=Rhododendron griersonianum TaxID=479676 RepID=A0AAV6IM00_9ERIC|nr:hypothetical protein RHGRI_030202 [Rhododendron griersonianum]
MSGRLTMVAATGGHGGAGTRGGQLEGRNGKDKDETESRDSRLIEVADDTEARDGLIGGPSTVVGSGGNSQSIVNLGCHIQEA